MAVAIARAAAALLVAAAMPAPASDAGAARPLALHADPPRLSLGRDDSARIAVDAGPGAAPAFAANVGHVSLARDEGGGHFVAEYVPPKAHYPQIAIVSASAGERFAWIAIPLHGRRVAIARTRPGAQIRVKIGDASAACSSSPRARWRAR